MLRTLAWRMIRLQRRFADARSLRRLTCTSEQLQLPIQAAQNHCGSVPAETLPKYCPNSRFGPELWQRFERSPLYKTRKRGLTAFAKQTRMSTRLIKEQRVTERVWKLRIIY